jgi:hypothetical protein
MRHTVQPSDLTPSVINLPQDLDRDHSKNHQDQATSLTIHPRATTTDGDLSSPDSNRDGNDCQVSCLVAGLYTRCSVSFGLCEREWHLVGVEYMSSV